jgi:predicted secreted protein
MEKSMSKIANVLTMIGMCVALTGAHAEGMIQTAGTMVVVPAYGEVRHPNDQAFATFMVEEQDKDKAAAASRVNLKMKQGTDILRKEDSQAILKTRGYYSYPIYAEDSASRQAGKQRQPIGWRVGQYVDLTTTNIDALPRTVAAAQRVIALSGLHFGLSELTARKLEEQRIAAAYRNLLDKVRAIAKAMGRNSADAVLDTLDFEGSGNYAGQEIQAMPKAMRMASADIQQVEEPSFEPGETTLSTRVVARVKFK